MNYIAAMGLLILALLFLGLAGMCWGTLRHDDNGFDRLAGVCVSLVASLTSLMLFLGSIACLFTKFTK